MRRRLISLLLGAMISLIFALLFYRNLMGMLITSPVIILVYLKNKKDIIEKNRKMIRLECRDALRATESGLRAGESLGRALLSAEPELEKLWGKESRLLQVWKTMNTRIGLKEPPERAFTGMAEAIGLYDLTELAELLGVAGKSGSSQAELIAIFSGQMYEKMTVEAEIQGRLTEKRMEKNIMLIMPPGILVYLSLTSYEWISPLYTSGSGRLFMTGVLVIYALAYMLGERYLKIRV